jgi:hypothetical protein
MVGKISPSDFMRRLRPENYSDTEDHASYALDAPTLDHHLDDNQGHKRNTTENCTQPSYATYQLQDGTKKPV